MKRFAYAVGMFVSFWLGVATCATTAEARQRATDNPYAAIEAEIAALSARLQATEAKVIELVQLAFQLQRACPKVDTTGNLREVP
jgi:hypothetical protein